MVFPLDDNFLFGDIFFSSLILFFFVPIKKYSRTNEVTHPTETPLYLWYDVFMPPPPLIFGKSRKKILLLYYRWEGQPNLCCNSKHLLFNFNFFRSISLLLKISFTDCYQSDNFLFAKSKLSTKNIFANIATKLCPGVRLFAFFHFLKIWNDNFFFKIIEKW